MTQTASCRTRWETRADRKFAFVELDNAAKANALNSALMDAFAAEIDHLGSDPALRAIVITGAGSKAFIGGADISEMAGLTAAEARSFITRVHLCCDAVRRCPVPVIARIAGHCYGAGMELAAACDIRVAARGARFGMPEVRLGIPSVVEAALLPMLIGWGRTRELLLLGDTYSAEEMACWGFVERLTDDAGLDDAVDTVLASLGAGGPKALRIQKQLIGSWEELPPREAIAAGVDAFARAYETGEPVAMMGDYLRARDERKRAERDRR